MTDVITSEEFYDSDQWHRHQRNLLRKRMRKLEERLDAMEIKGITDTTVFRRPNHEDFIPVDDDGVWKVSATTMNLLYAMFLWSGKNGIDNEDDWEDHLKLMREHLNNLQGAKK